MDENASWVLLAGDVTCVSLGDNSSSSTLSCTASLVGTVFGESVDGKLRTDKLDVMANMTPPIPWRRGFQSTILELWKPCRKLRKFNSAAAPEEKMRRKERSKFIFNRLCIGNTKYFMLNKATSSKISVVKFVNRFFMKIWVEADCKLIRAHLPFWHLFDVVDFLRGR